MKQIHFSKTVTCALIAMFSVTAASAQQCKDYVKKKCMPKISPFTQNGQMNTATLAAGQNTDMNLTFYAGQDYRILVCAEEILGDVTFQVMDMSHKVVFDSKDNNFPDFWDFKVKNTQQFIVHVTVPVSSSSASVPPSGCVSVMVGFKKD
ncbi:MAG: hypothetical protein JWP12_3676 [Bacteroidetes bacterium]|nr:hypothetical protein [Bacteroidota bacterium]